MRSRQSVWIGALLCLVGQNGSSSLLGQQPVPGVAPAQAATLVTALPGQRLFPSVAPASQDGKMIAGNRSFIDRFVPGGIFVYTLATRTFRMILDGAAGARWLNDNRRLIYPDAAARKIFLVDTRSGQQQAVLSVDPQDLGPFD